jgi:hypothetical protein
MKAFDYFQQRQPLNVPNSPMGMQAPQPQIPQSLQAPQGGSPMSGEDAALRAMLAIEALSPEQKKMQRQRAQAQQLRDLALGGGAQHWTGVLAQGLAGGLSGYQDRKLDPQEEAMNERRRRAMEQFGGSIY